ncbi:hypothetical protein Btru_056030 [Bulinus truncatus]|nr:hypothetical protein Btru_056030 [Bulinus truncatus]
MKECRPDCTKGTASGTSSLASTSDDRRSSIKDKLSAALSQPGDPEYYEFLDTEYAIREVSNRSLNDIRHFSRVTRFSIEEEKVVGERDFHIVEQLYYNSYVNGKYMVGFPLH